MKETKIDLIAMQNENVPTNTMQMGSCTIFVYTWNINIKYVNKLRLICAPPASRPNIY